MFYILLLHNKLCISVYSYKNFTQAYDVSVTQPSHSNNIPLAPFRDRPKTEQLIDSPSSPIVVDVFLEVYF